MKNTRLLKGLMIATIIIFILVFALADRKEPTVIDDKTAFSPPKKIELIVVKKGECLSVIADQRHTSWQELAKLNNMENPSFVREGQILKVPAIE